MTFSVLLRGYGDMSPPNWVLISGLLKMMDKRFGMKPSLGDPGLAKMLLQACTSSSAFHVQTPFALSPGVTCRILAACTRHVLLCDCCARSLDGIAPYGNVTDSMCPLHALHKALHEHQHDLVDDQR